MRSEYGLDNVRRLQSDVEHDNKSSAMLNVIMSSVKRNRISLTHRSVDISETSNAASEGLVSCSR